MQIESTRVKVVASQYWMQHSLDYSKMMCDDQTAKCISMRTVRQCHEHLNIMSPESLLLTKLIASSTCSSFGGKRGSWRELRPLLHLLQVGSHLLLHKRAQMRMPNGNNLQ